MEKMETWTIEERRDMEINAKAMNTLIYALSHEEFNCISTCKIVKEIWDKLKVTHEGHMRNECSKLKKNDPKKKKVKKKAQVAWSEEDLSSSDDSQDEEVANVCFMTKLENEVTSQTPNLISEFTFEELHDAFNIC